MSPEPGWNHPPSADGIYRGKKCDGEKREAERDSDKQASVCVHGPALLFLSACVSVSA